MQSMVGAAAVILLAWGKNQGNHKEAGYIIAKHTPGHPGASEYVWKTNLYYFNHF